MKTLEDSGLPYLWLAFIVLAVFLVLWNKPVSAATATAYNAFSVTAPLGTAAQCPPPAASAYIMCPSKDKGLLVSMDGGAYQKVTLTAVK